MRMHGAEWVGSLALALVVTAATAWAQTVPSAGVNALDQAAPDSPSSLFPTSGLTLEGPSGFEQTQDAENSHSRPSDGLGLQIYDAGSPIPAGPGDNDRGTQGSRNP